MGLIYRVVLKFLTLKKKKEMKQFIGMLALVAFLCACQENNTANDDFTGNETTYALASGSAYPVNGTVTFKEKKDGTAWVRLELSGTEGELKHPVHLHLGSIA